MSITDIDFMQFLTQGDSLRGISLNDSVGKLYGLLGQPIEIVGDKKAGFLHFKGLRYWYVEDEIAEMAIIFYNEDDLKFSIVNELNEEFTISNLMFLHEFMYFLSSIPINWECRGSKYQNGCTLIVKKKIYIEFDLETGFLRKVYVARL